MKRKSHLKEIMIASLLLCIALVARLSYVTHTEVDKPFRADARYYTIYAQNLVHYGVFSKQIAKEPTPDSFWAPAYPALLAAILYLADAKHFYVSTLFVQAILGALITGMVFAIGAHFLPLWAAAGAGMFTACSPHLISLGGYLLTETLFAFMLVSFLLAYIRALKTQKAMWFGLAGILSGIAYLVNPVIFFLPFLMVILFFLRPKEAKHPLHTGKMIIIVFLVTFMLPFVLWSVRGHLNVPSTSSSSADRALTNFIIGTHHDFFDIWQANPRDPNSPAEIDKKAVNGSWAKFVRILSQRISASPGHYAKWYFYDKPRLLWSWNILIGQGDIYVYPVITSWFITCKSASLVHLIMKSIHWWLFFLATLGVIFIFKKIRHPQDEMAIAVYVMLVYVSAVYVILQAEPRYSIPLRPAMYLCAMFGLWQISRLTKTLFNSINKNRLQRKTR
ncbi:ArnT family glycosyltransferase [Thermodesulfobacteriota bacterium]